MEMIKLALGIGALVELFKTVLPGIIQDRVSPKPSPERSIILSLNLYQCLESMKKIIDEFLDIFIQLKNSDSKDITAQHIYNLIKNIRKELRNLIKNLDELYPQIGIYQKEIFGDILNYSQARIKILDQVERAIRTIPRLLENDVKNYSTKKVIFTFSSGSSSHWEHNFQEQEDKLLSNQKLLNEIIDEFEKFLKQEFAFKDTLTK